MSSDSEKKPAIVIVGDWFIDEYWFVVEHHSTVSSHVGQVHYRIFSDRYQPVKDLCGAGLVARIMYNLITEEKLKEGVKKLIGIGSWHPVDRDLIAHFVHAKCHQDPGLIICNSYSLKPIYCNNPPWITLNNLQNIDNPYCPDRPKDQDPSLFTTPGTTVRVIRFYKFDGKKFKQLSRVDWEPKPDPKPDSTCLTELNSKLSDKIVKQIADTPISSVIIEDHCKGVINGQLIKALKEKCSEQTKWYVRTKDKNVLPTPSQGPAPETGAGAAGKQPENNLSWLNVNDEKIQIQLLALGPEISTRFYPIGGLLTEDKNIAWHAYEMIKDLTKLPEIKNLVLTSDKMELIFCEKDSTNDGCHIYIFKPSFNIKNIELEKLNWTSAIFASLTHEMILNEEADNPILGIENIKKAISDAYKNSGVNDPIEFKKGRQAIEEKTDVTPLEWSKVEKEWGQAIEGIGIINTENKLQLWRASTDLPGHIICVAGKRKAINEIWQKMDNFKRNPKVKPCSILLEADPGSGKTRLARKLSDQLGFDFIQHDITQMVSRDELLDLFDSIATAQAEDDDNKGLVVFVDEINATLDGSPVYGAFLSPLEAGYYMRHGIKIKLKPCIWIFAGTRNKNNSEQKEKAMEKLEDFNSRLSLIKKIDYKALEVECLDQSRLNSDEEMKLVNEWLKECNLRLQGHNTYKEDGVHVKRVLEQGSPFTEGEIEKLFNLDRQARLEQVYIGATIVHEAFPDVLQIDKQVLEFFYHLDPASAPGRLIERLARSLENVQYGQVDSTNCTSIDWENMKRKSGMKKFCDCKIDLITLEIR
jgi:hypothetical protein